MVKDTKYLAANIKYLRVKRGLSQTELSKLLGVSQVAVAKYETGQTMPETKNLIELSRIFKVTLDQLLKPMKSETRE